MLCVATSPTCDSSGGSLFWSLNEAHRCMIVNFSHLKLNYNDSRAVTRVKRLSGDDFHMEQTNRTAGKTERLQLSDEERR